MLLFLYTNLKFLSWYHPSRRAMTTIWLTERNCMDESPNGRQFFVLFFLSRVLFCCRKVSWPIDCRSVETMLAIDSLGNSMNSSPLLMAYLAGSLPSVSHKGTHHQNGPARNFMNYANFVKFMCNLPLISTCRSCSRWLVELHHLTQSPKSQYTCCR